MRAGAILRGAGKLAVLLLALPVAAAGADRAAAAPGVELLYHSTVSLGNESFEVKPWKSVLTVLASAQNPEFEGWRLELREGRRVLVGADGNAVRSFPGRLDFRVSAGTLTRLFGVAPFPLEPELSPNDFLLQLGFRLKVFRGLHQAVFEPDEVALIGVPADVPYNERIYRVSFDLQRIPVEDRVVLEVLAPGGDRLCKFHLDLN